MAKEGYKEHEIYNVKFGTCSPFPFAYRVDWELYGDPLSTGDKYELSGTIRGFIEEWAKQRRKSSVTHEEKGFRVCVFVHVCIHHCVCPWCSHEGASSVCDPGSHSWRKWQSALSHNSLRRCLQQYITLHRRYMKHTISLSRGLDGGFTVGTLLWKILSSVRLLPTEYIQY